MSAKSLGELAEDRDVNPPGLSVGSATDVLVAAVPSEALAAYTTLIGIVLAASIGSAYSQFRWSAYGVFVAVAVLAPFVVYRHRVARSSKEKRIFPMEECLVAGLAAAAWGLVMPGSPMSIVLKGNALVFSTTAIVLGAATAIGFTTPLLGSANRKNPVGEAAVPAAEGAAAVPAADGAAAVPAADTPAAEGAAAVPAADSAAAVPAADGAAAVPAADGAAAVPAADPPAADSAAAAPAADGAAAVPAADPPAAEGEAAVPAAEGAAIGQTER
jgi:hypothetical protein